MPQLIDCQCLVCDGTCTRDVDAEDLLCFRCRTCCKGGKLPHRRVLPVPRDSDGVYRSRRLDGG